MSEAYVTVTQLRLCVLATVRSELIFKIGMLKHTKSFEVNFLFQLDFKLTVVYASSMLKGRLMSFLIRMCSFVKDELEYFFIFFVISQLWLPCQKLNVLQPVPISISNALRDWIFVI